MADIWAFLLQTLTASGAAVLLIVVKAMFRDKLSPRWQFAVWGVLGLVLLIPAGWGGRYVLLNWPLLIEAAKSALTGQFGTLTHVAAPVPLPPANAPKSAADWLYLIYLAGIVVLLARYLAAYIGLRLALKRGRPVQDERVRAVGVQYHLPVCPAVEVDGLPTAFICGVFKPVLALPAGVETDEKVILHELLHLKNRDVAWGLLICFFRCVHWCNPLLWLCADWAGNDLESLCDQRVLERLEGENRRDYGRILLSMADEKYARAPGTSSAANGGRNIRRRIEAIARFKRYPAGMALVSVCVALVLAAPLITGTWAETPQRWSTTNAMVMASARTTWCTTYAGAFDTYAKALLTGEISYRAMCAPLSEQDELAKAGDGYNREVSWLWNQAGDVRSWPNSQQGYQIYNLTQAGDGWEGLLVLELNYTPNGGEEWADWDSTTASRWLAIQPLRAEKEGSRWVILPLDKMKAVQGDERDGGNLGLPAWVYEARYGDFILRVQRQTTVSVDSYVQSNNGFWNITTFDTVPHPRAVFERAYRHDLLYALYTGDPADKENYSHIAAASIPVYGDASRYPWVDSDDLYEEQAGGGSTTGTSWGSKRLEGDWGDWQFLCGGGSSMNWEKDEGYQVPDAYAATLYLDHHLAAKLTLPLTEEGGEWIEG